MATRKKASDQQSGATIQKGNHLTVVTNSDGSTQLIWDDAALLQEVRNAIAAYQAQQPAESKPATKTRTKKIK